MTEELAWKLYNFMNEWKQGKYGAVPLQKALDEHFSVWRDASNPPPINTSENCDGDNSREVIVYTRPIDWEKGYAGRYRKATYNHLAKEWSLYGWQDNNTIVTHWIYLPQPPKKRNED